MSFTRKKVGVKVDKMCAWCGDRIVYNADSMYCDAICYMNWHKAQGKTKSADKMVKVNDKTWVALKKGETEAQAIERMNKKLNGGLSLDGTAASKQQALGFRNKPKV